MQLTHIVLLLFQGKKKIKMHEPALESNNNLEKFKLVSGSRHERSRGGTSESKPK